MAEAMPIENGILSDFECPICTHYMFPPIHQCVNGHSYCPTCFWKIRRCSQCRGAKSNARCYTLEKIHSKLTFPCKYQIEGCVVGAKGMLIKDHEKLCEYTRKMCPLKTMDLCNWHGRKRDFVKHAREMHPSHIFFDYKQKLVSRDFTLYTSRQYCGLFAVFNELFRLTWDLNDETGSMRFAVYSINRPVQDTYTYQISFLRRDSDREVISFKAPCAYCDTDYGRFIPSNYIVVNYDMVRQLCDADGSLHYMVKISDNDVFKQFLNEHFTRDSVTVDLDAAASRPVQNNEDRSCVSQSSRFEAEDAHEDHNEGNPFYNELQFFIHASSIFGNLQDIDP